MKVLFVILFASLGAFPAWSATHKLACTIRAERNGVSMKTQTVEIPLNGGAECVKYHDYLLPDTSITVSMKGHGDCNPNPEDGCDDRPTVGAIEIFDRESGNYTKANWTCYQRFTTNHIQLISNGKVRVNVIVWCDLVTSEDKR